MTTGVIRGGGDDDESAGAAPAPAPDAAAVPIETSTTTQPPVVTVGEPADTKVPLERTLGDGMVGDDVVRVQQRLADLGFDPGPVDGQYGLMTKQSVWAFEKLVMETPRTEINGQVTSAIWDRMQDPIEIRPLRSHGAQGNHVEIYLVQQVMIVFQGDQPAVITHVSTGELDAAGEPKQWCAPVTYSADGNGNLLDEPITRHMCGFAKTPPGVFQAYRRVEGVREAALGRLYDPIYINFGIAIHGSKSVPDHPASRGCIRVPMHISAYLQDLVGHNATVYIWDGKKEPEQQNRYDSAPAWDFEDPTMTTTTTTSTTTTTTTTLPSAVETVPPTTPPTEPPPATTTTAPPPPGG